MAALNAAARALGLPARGDEPDAALRGWTRDWALSTAPTR